MLSAEREPQRMTQHGPVMPYTENNGAVLSSQPAPLPPTPVPYPGNRTTHLPKNRLKSRST